MGKTLDQLKLSDQPIQTPRSSDLRQEPWYQFSRDIDDLLATGSYTWAEGTLRDIQATVERTQTVSDGQRRAVGNIEAARGRSEGGYRRRYEGFRR
jgi:hypothetical protein